MLTDTDPTHPRVLEDDDLWMLSEHVDLAATLRAAGPLPTDGDLAPDLTGNPTHAVYRDRSTGRVTLLPRDSLTALCEAARLAAEARRLIGTGTLTVGMIGPAPSLWWYAGVLCRTFTGITDLLACVSPPVDAASDERPLSRLVDQLDLAGIGFAMTGDSSGIAFGSTLLVVAAPLDLTSECVTPGALVLEAAPGLLSDEVHRQSAAALPFDARSGRLPPNGYVIMQRGHADADDTHRVAAGLLAADRRLELMRPD